jgi:molybdenum cofactor cytidylyltransferase
MKFRPVPLEQAEGKILGHHIAAPDGKRAFNKGKPLSQEDIEGLCQLGRTLVYVAEMEPGDVDEDTAAHRIAVAIQGNGLRLTKAHLGRVNLKATELGLLVVDTDRLYHLNECEGITVATLAINSPVQTGKTVATVKILPFAVPDTYLYRAEKIASQGDPVLSLIEMEPRRVALVLSGSPAVEERVVRHFKIPLEERIEALGSEIASVDYIPLEDDQGEADLVSVLLQRIAAGAGLIILAGETAIMDRHDIAPRAIERAGGEVTCFGAPVDPGNLLMLAYLKGIPILGAPGCARSPKTNVIDWVLPRLLAGHRLTRRDIISLGHGGLLEDTSLRPVPRSRSNGQRGT